MTIDGKITTLILAGGESRRMGQDKALLQIEGEPLLSRLSRMAGAWSETVAVITPRCHFYKPLLPSNCQLIEEQSLFGETLPHGALWGFIQGLRQIKTDWIFLLACDLPCLSSGVVEGWIEYVNNLPSGYLAVLPKHPKGWEPLCGFYHRHCQGSLEESVCQGNRSFQKWLNSLSVAELPVQDSKVLLNCNTPEDWQTLFPMPHD